MIKPSLKKQMFVDLDSMLEDKVCFVFKGKEYTLKNLDVQTFMALTNELANVNEMLASQSVSPREVAERYTALINSVCEDVTLEMVESMTQSQAAALLQLCVDYASGRVHLNKDIEKKSLNPTQIQ